LQGWRWVVCCLFPYIGVGVHWPTLVLAFGCPMLALPSFHPPSSLRAVARETGDGSWVMWYVTVCPVAVRVGGMSGDVAGYRVHRVHTSQISPSRGLLLSLCTLLAHVNSLTSHLNGRRGWLHFALAPIVGIT
jgi:hypothetical protein